MKRLIFSLLLVSMASFAMEEKSSCSVCSEQIGKRSQSSEYLGMKHHSHCLYCESCWKAKRELLRKLIARSPEQWHTNQQEMGCVDDSDNAPFDS